MTKDSDTATVELAVSILERGGLVAIPTETVYGLAANAEDAQAVASIYQAKKRPADHPLIVHLASSATIPAWATDIPRETEALTNAFWPGPLTLVLPRSARAKDFITGSQDTVALRCPSHPLAHAILQSFDKGLSRGIAAPSANSFGKISPTTAQHVRDDLGEKPLGKVDFIVDGGACDVGIESTILDLSSKTPRILREGAITSEMIANVIGKSVLRSYSPTSPRVSGSLKSHYAPKHPLELVHKEALVGRAQFLARHFQSFSLIAPHSIAQRFAPISACTFGYDESNPSELTHNLYEWMHELDRQESSVILVVCPPNEPSWAGVIDRLTRASAPRDQS